MTMAGAVPGSTIQIDLLRLMSAEDVSYIVEGFLTKAGQTADSCRPPAGVKAFQHFWSIASKYTNEREERKDSVSAQNHADKSAGKLLEKSTSVELRTLAVYDSFFTWISEPSAKMIPSYRGAIRSLPEFGP